MMPDGGVPFPLAFPSPIESARAIMIACILALAVIATWR